MGHVRGPMIWARDFNDHNPLWGSDNRDNKYVLVVIKDGRPTR